MAIPGKHNEGVTALLDKQARQTLQSFADCLLVPVRPGVDPDSVPPPWATEAESHDFRAKLATHNAVVVLGGRSAGLFGIQLENESELLAFLQRNPHSRNTLISSHGGRPIVWHKADVPYRTALRLPGLTVQMTGNVLVLDRGGLSRVDVIVNNASPNTVNVETIDWGADTSGAVDVWLTSVLEGELFRPGINVNLIPNRSSWRSYLVRRLRPLVAYEPLEHRFYLRTELGGWRPFSEDELRPRLRELVMTAPVGTPAAKAALNDRWLDKLVRRLRSLLPAGPAILHARLREFARDCLKIERGNEVTVVELYHAFVAWCHEHELPVVPVEVFQQTIPVILRAEPWFRCKSKSIDRESGCQNGFRSLGFRKTYGAHVFVQTGVVGVAG